jgi:micrococcal nuclease
MYKYKAKVLRIVDGDTLDLTVDLGFGFTFRARVRLADFDAPESFRPSCQAEKEHANEVVAFLEEVIPKGTEVLLDTNKTGKYGRWIGDIEARGGDLVDWMKRLGFEKREHYVH